MRIGKNRQKLWVLNRLRRNRVLKPRSTIGIVGGGQLGRMLAMSAARLGYQTLVLDPDENAPAFQVSNGKIIAAYNDAEAMKALGEKSDVITYEFENVPVDALNTLSKDVPVHPNTRALATSQDRLVEKMFFKNLEITTAPFFDCASPEGLDAALAKTGGSGILKTRRFGYDGKGQVRLSPDKPQALEEAHKVISQSRSILEGFVDFEREISVIAARSTTGEVKAFDIAENVHRDGILHTSTVPANASTDVQEAARSISEQVLNALEYVGVIGIEFFLMADGTLAVNEFAPRVHNSGHWTEAACAVSQFEQHIRAIAGLPLGATTRHSDCRMENLIGDDVEKVPEILKAGNTVLHLYGKAEIRPGRKMGHFTSLRPISD